MKKKNQKKTKNKNKNQNQNKTKQKTNKQQITQEKTTIDQQSQIWYFSLFKYQFDVLNNMKVILNALIYLFRQIKRTHALFIFWTHTQECLPDKD